ncbi:ATP-binding protein, partial [Escherichia coli]|nr:ATP-binding protein [Escherichia coli]
MINSIAFKKFKKIEDLSLDFSPDINLISGPNGSCKTTLLHLISNAFQMPALRSPNYKNSNCVKVLKAINKITNPKLEAIVRESNTYTDPAEGRKGPLFTVNYQNNTSLNFRKHNSDKANRYAIKPLYPRGGEKQSLPSKPVLYLGLSRLFPIGETKDEALSNTPFNLPDEYIHILSSLYKDFLGITINNIRSSNIGDFKSGPLFSTDNPEIDSNTISSGEDNLFIITRALVSLRFYYESLISSDDQKESVLLIDEFDATLHPSLQIKLLDKIKEYATLYKIQVFITTHSITLLEHAFERKYNVLYLMNNYSSVFSLEEPDYLKISMFLKTKTKDETYTRNKIPIFTEDKEARFLLEEIFNYWVHKNPNLAIIHSLFHFVDCSIGADNLLTIFNDPHLMETSLKSICILDGDHSNDIRKGVIALPGNQAPEEIIFNHSESILKEDDPSFWKNPDIYNQGYTKEYYLTVVRPQIESIDAKIQQKKKLGESTKGIKRAMNKEVFNSYRSFFQMILRHWLEKNKKEQQMESFYSNLQILF